MLNCIYFWLLSCIKEDLVSDIDEKKIAFGVNRGEMEREEEKGSRAFFPLDLFLFYLNDFCSKYVSIFLLFCLIICRHIYTLKIF